MFLRKILKTDNKREALDLDPRSASLKTTPHADQVGLPCKANRHGFMQGLFLVWLHMLNLQNFCQSSWVFGNDRISLLESCLAWLVVLNGSKLKWRNCVWGHELTWPSNVLGYLGGDYDLDVRQLLFGEYDTGDKLLKVLHLRKPDTWCLGMVKAISFNSLITFVCLVWK